jgi:hypothetical protein
MPLTRQVIFHGSGPLGVDQDAAIGVEQRLVSLEKDRECLAVSETDPGGPVGERIGIHRGRGVQGRAHATAQLPVPAAVRIKPRILPQRSLPAMSAAVIAPRCEGCRCLRNALECVRRIRHIRNSRRIRSRSHDDEVVVHHVPAVDAVSVGNELVLSAPIMHQQGVRIATAADVQCLAGADGHHPHLYAGLLHEQREQVSEQTRLLRGGGRGERDVTIRRL